MEQSETILACPFCGCERTYVRGTMKDGYKVECYKCVAHGAPGVDSRAAISWWNLRAGAGGALNDNRGERLGAVSGSVTDEELRAEAKMLSERWIKDEGLGDPGGWNELLTLAYTRGYLAGVGRGWYMRHQKQLQADTGKSPNMRTEPIRDSHRE